MSENKPKKNPITGIIDFFKNLWSEDLSDPGLSAQKRFKQITRFLIVSYDKFMRDEAILRGTGISYSLIVSFVPTFIVIMLFSAGFIDLEAYLALGSEWVRKNGIPIDPEPYIQIIRDLDKNKGKIGGIGALVILFSATTVLRNTENALNRIWRVSQDRPMLQKISGFLMVMIFGPVLLTLGISYGQLLLNKFASPHLRSISITADSIAITGEKNVFDLSDKKSPWKPVRAVALTDFSFDNQTIILSRRDNVVLSREQINNAITHIPKLDVKIFSTETFVDYATTSERRFLLGESGSLLVSADNGKSWRARSFLTEENGSLQGVRFSKILFSGNTGIIAGARGLLLVSRDGGATWAPSFQRADNDIHSIADLGNGRFAVVGDALTALISEDGGSTWANWTSLRSSWSEKPVNLRSISVNGNLLLVAGESGFLLTSPDRGATWKQHIMAQSFDFRSAVIVSEDNYIVAGERGEVRVSKRNADGSLQWYKIRNATKSDITEIAWDSARNKIYMVGKNYSILANHNPIQNGNLQNLSLEIVQKAPFWRKLISATGNVILPFVVIWILFFLMYRILPYTHVTYKAAAIGAATTSIIWVVFLIVFRYYVEGFSSGTFALYGTLAAIPLILLLVYTSILIMLYGAVIAFLVQYPGVIRLSAKKLENEIAKKQIWYGFHIVYTLASSFVKGKGEVAEKDLLKICNNDHEELDYIMEKLTALKFAIVTDKKEYILGKPPQEISLKTLFEKFDPSDYEIPAYSEKNIFMKETKKIFDSIVSARHKVYDGVTMADIMKGD